MYYVDLCSPDQVVVISDDVKERLAATPIAIIAAQHGTMLIDGSDKNESPLVEDVIGWAIANDGSPTPITPSGYDDSCVNSWAIQMPSGRVIRPYAGSYDNVEDYVSSL